MEVAARRWTDRAGYVSRQNDPLFVRFGIRDRYGRQECLGVRVPGIVEDFKDISERKRSEKEVMASREKLRSLAAHLQVVREEERQRILEDLDEGLINADEAIQLLHEFTD